jgi:hypothetical protein
VRSTHCPHTTCVLQAVGAYAVKGWVLDALCWATNFEATHTQFFCPPRARLARPEGAGAVSE